MIAGPLLERSLLALLITAAAAAADEKREAPLKSLEPENVLSVLDLSGPGLEQARAAAGEGNRAGALAALLKQYRERHPETPLEASLSPKTRRTADDIVNHVFQWGPYEPAEYGKDVDWEADPRGDIEWVAAMYRFHWAEPLAEAYRQTHDEKYAQAFVELASDWIAKHPLEKSGRVHPVYTHWKGFPWLDIQTGRRARSICRAFPALVHAQAFTPEFLGVLLASLYDHQVKTEAVPRAPAHNKAIFEQRGFVEVATAFPEFKDSRRWLELALERTRISLMSQTTADGVQREWATGYHRGVLEDAVWVFQKVETAGIPIPPDCRERTRRMADYLFAVATPDLAYPMFGDAGRPPVGPRRKGLPLYREFLRLASDFDDPKYRALADLDVSALPALGSFAFPEAGTYVLRNGWGPDGIYFALHCPPPGLSNHDQPDNGTFELFAYGRWLMTDTGYYTYGHDSDLRKWHRQTRVHQTLTLDNRDSEVQGKHLLWRSTPAFDVVAVENAAYPGLVHRRTVWFVDRSFFVILDEAVGDAPGTLDLHFQFAPGDVQADAALQRAFTRFDDANVLVVSAAPASVGLEQEEGWTAGEYGSREPRKALRFAHPQAAPAGFLTLVVPYRGKAVPEAAALLAPGFQPGAAVAEIEAKAFGQSWRLRRDLTAGDASVTRE